MNLLLLLFLLVSVKENFGQERLKLLILLPENGAEDCRIATEIALARGQNILSGTEILPLFRPQSYPAARAVIEFAKNCSSGTNCSPIIIGPIDYIDCLAIGSSLQLFDFLTLTPGCRSPKFTRPNNNGAQIYPNLLRTQIPEELHIFAKVKFITEIGNWSRVVVLTSQPGTDSYLVSKLFQVECEKMGIAIPLFLATSQLTEAALREIQMSPFKILVVDLADTAAEALQFFCMAQSAGISPENGYIFIFKWQTYVTTNNSSGIPENCDRQKFQKQLSSSFWIGDAILGAGNMKNATRTLLGYNLTEFRQEFFAKKKPDPTYFPGVIAFHDTILQALLTIRETQNRSQEPLLSLASKIEFTPLANGGQTLKYSDRLEMDSHLQFVYQFNPKLGSVEAIYQVQLLPGQAFNQSTSYRIEPVLGKDYIWGDGNYPPEDAKLVITEVEQVPIPAFVILCAVAIFLIIGQLYSLALTFVLRWYQPVMTTLPCSKACLIEGLLYMNTAAILLIVNRPSRLDLLCRFRWLFVILSTTRVHSIIVAKVACYYKRIRYQEDFAARLTLKNVVQKNERFVLISSRIFTTTCIGLLLLWFLLDPLRAELVPVGSEQKLEPSIYRPFLAETCTSDYQPYWIALFSTLNVGLLFSGSIFALLTRGVQYQPEFGFSDVAYHQVAVWVSLFNCLATIAVVAALHGMPTSQMIAISTSLLVSSFGVDSLVFFPKSRANSRQLFATLKMRGIGSIGRVAAAQHFDLPEIPAIVLSVPTDTSQQTVP